MRLPAWTCQRLTCSRITKLATTQAPLTLCLGGTSGAEADKATACEELGWPWLECPECGDECLLPGCVTYCRLTQQGELIDAGSHDVAICLLERVFVDDTAAGPSGALSTAALRDAGLITAAGRVADP